MNFAQKIAKLEKQLAATKAKQARLEGKRLAKLAKSEGHGSIDAFIKALAVYASPVLKGKLGGKAAAARPAAAAPKKKRVRAKIDDRKRAAIIADLKEKKLTAAAIAAKHGVSVPSVNKIKKEAGLVGK